MNSWNVITTENHMSPGCKDMLCENMRPDYVWFTLLGFMILQPILTWFTGTYGIEDLKVLPKASSQMNGISRVMSAYLHIILIWATT